MRPRQHSVLLLLMFIVMMSAGLMVHGGYLINAPLWVKSFATSVALAGALVCAIEMIDRFLFGGDQ